MSHHITPRVGGVLSADIAVPEHERELRFYSRVLTTGEQPFWREDLMNSAGMPVIGLGARSPEYAGLPLQWMPHIQVADVAASVERALELGGSALMHAKGDDGSSQWAVLLDPNGAAFGIIPVVPADAIPATEGAAYVGCISWLDLTVPDAPATCEFYRQVVGWTVQRAENADTSDRHADHIMLGDDGNPAAGIHQAPGESGGLPAGWVICLPVGDLAESLGQVRAEGGRVLKATRGADGAYEAAVVEDPVGASLALVQGPMDGGARWGARVRSGSCVDACEWQPDDECNPCELYD